MNAGNPIKYQHPNPKNHLSDKTLLIITPDFPDRENSISVRYL